MPIQWNPLSWVDKLISDRMMIAGRAMVGIAKALAPVDTGFLKENIYFTYNPDAKLLTLHSDAFYSIYNELGTYRMKPHPYMRPAINAAAPSFLTGRITGVATQMMVGTSMDQHQLPRLIQPHIRPHIAAANMTHNVGAAARSKFTAIHMDRNGEARRRKVGLKQESRIVMSDLSKAKLNKIRRAWN